ncbi:MAG: PEP/pyruvate-binding domain-containing protein [Chloroflexota bacterium]
MPRPESSMIAWLGVVQGDVASVGGKAASLDRLARLGFRIPPGFCLTTAAFDAQLVSIPGAASDLDRLGDEDVRLRLIQGFETAPLVATVEDALDAAVTQLAAELQAIGGPARFAVRSSGIGEDSSAASFAGLHETELDVPPDGVADAVRRCWASLWSAPAIAYRQRQGLALDGGGMAIVVQALVPASSAAVVFTRHPVTGRTDQLVITSVRGLGDAMVSGTITPDTWVVDRSTLASIEYTPGDGRDMRAGPAIADTELRELAGLALDVERGFGGPVDIEAAAAGGQWFLLQARPITTLPGEPTHDDPGQGTTPDVSPAILTGTADFPVDWEDPTDPTLTWDRDDMHMPFALGPLAADYIRTLGEGFNFRYTYHGGFPQRWRARVWNGYAYFAMAHNAPEEDRPGISERWQAAMRRQVEVTEAWWRDEALPEIRQLEAGVRTIRVEELAPAALAEAWDRAWAATLRMWDIHFIAIEGPYTAVEELADFYDTLIPDAPPGEAVRLIGGSANELFDVETGVEGLARTARAHPELERTLTTAALAAPGSHRAVQVDDLANLDGGPAFLAELETFLEVHGHLGQAFDDLSEASWGDEPAILVAQVGHHLVSPPEAAEVRRLRLRSAADALAEGVRARLVGEPAKAAEFERLLAYGRAIGPLTEVHNYWIDRLAQARIRTLALRVGRRLVANGSLDAPEEILFLFRDEVRAEIEHTTDRRPLVATRRAELARWATLSPPRIIGVDPGKRESDRFDGERFTSDDPRTLRGTGASAGIVRGTARVTLGPADFARLQPGDIIVCPSSNPSWVPVFTTAGGLVTNTGGVLSHAAVVAREFGLAAVVGIENATTRIPDGSTVEIDGTLGTVRLL